MAIACQRRRSATGISEPFEWVRPLTRWRTSCIIFRAPCPDDFVFIYVRPVDDSQYEKIPGTAGHARYLLFKQGYDRTGVSQ